MAYIGKEPLAGNFVKLDAITTSATATYPLERNSVAFKPANAESLLVQQLKQNENSEDFTKQQLFKNFSSRVKR